MGAISYVNAPKKKGKRGRPKSAKGGGQNVAKAVQKAATAAANKVAAKVGGKKKGKRGRPKSRRGMGGSLVKSIMANAKVAAIEAGGALATDFIFAKATFIPVEYRTGYWQPTVKAGLAIAVGAVLDNLVKGNTETIKSAVRGTLTVALHRAGTKAINDAAPGTLPVEAPWPQVLNESRAPALSSDSRHAGRPLSLASSMGRPLPMDRPLHDADGLPLRSGASQYDF